MPIIHESDPKKKSSKLPISGLVLSVKDLKYDYPDGHQALKGISVAMKPGEKVALVGPNGSGKSTFILNINGLLKGQGEIEICETRLSKKTIDIIRSEVGLVFQNPDDQLFSPTVFEDVAFGPLHMGEGEEEVYKRVDKALAQVGMSEFKDRLSHHLSMGEKKRIAIATVLSMSPNLLILDEPTAGLDPRARRQLINLLDQLPISMLVATHDLWMVRELFPRMIVLDGGELVADGKTEQLMKDKDFLDKHGLEFP